jgi:hypothetical protein
MMNNRLNLFKNKTTSNKIKILELLGFESDIILDQSYIKTEKPQTSDEEVAKQTFEDLLKNTTEIPIKKPKPTLDELFSNDTNIVDSTPTDTFNPLNITQQIQKVWSDLESRRKWVLPVLIIVATFLTLGVVTTSFLNYRSQQTTIIEQSVDLTNNSNELLNLIPTLIEISTNTFYSKYDVSNASANLQQIESSIIEYNNNFLARDDIENKEITQNNLNQILILINDLDLVISYRILISEILIYSKLPVTEEEVNIEELTTELSSIIATSKVNFGNLPDIPEFSNHKNLVKTAITTAEDLHGRYLAALRNNEYDVASSISTAILLNKNTEITAFENSLEVFKEKSLESYERIEKLP